MAKYYTPEEATPVFAVTFVTNRKGVIPEPKATIDRPEDYEANEQKIKQIEQEIVKLKEYVDSFTLSDRGAESRAKTKEEIENLQAELADLKRTNNSVTSIKDTEYLIYSNVEIRPSSPTDLSQQSSWYLREAEVEVTRDWPLSKAKLIVTCKQNDDGSIPDIVEVERGFVYDQEDRSEDSTGLQRNFIQTMKGRMLSVEDEVRIYAGYKSETCVTINDLDEYPFSFEVTEIKKLSDADTQQLLKLEKDRDKLKEEIKKIQEIGSLQDALPPSLEELKNKQNLILAKQQELAITEKLINAIQKRGGTQTKEYTATKPLAPIFWGFIDSVDFTGNPNSIQIIYNLRDRSRLLADTKLITLPFLNAGSDEKGAFEGLRHKTIEGVYRGVNGGIYLDNSFNNASTIEWRKNFDSGSIITLYDQAVTGKDSKGKNKLNNQIKKIDENYASALAEERIKFSAAIEDPARWVLSNGFLPNPKDKYDPLFHIWTLQPPLVSGNGSTSLQIINKSPFEILEYLARTEVMPIDIFVSHINGHFMFAPRILDTTGLQDEERGNRIYFFFECFDKEPTSRNVIKELRSTLSSIGVYNRFTIASSDFNNPTNSSLKDVTTIVDISSSATKNRKVPVKQHIITDPKINSADKLGMSKEAAAQSLALTSASIVGRDVVSIIIKVMGDSSFYPGEAIRIYNTVLHNNKIVTFKSGDESGASFLKALYTEIQSIRSRAKDQKGSSKKILNLTDVIKRIRDTTTEETDILNGVLPTYAIRSITHSLKSSGNDAGYTTKLVGTGSTI